MAQYSKRFTKRHTSNGYAAMGKSLRRPIISMGSVRDVAAAIAAERRKAVREAAARKKK